MDRRSDNRAARVRVLGAAHAGEFAAALASRCHWHSIRHEPEVQAEIRRIEGAEWHHRSLVTAQLARMGERPNRVLETVR